MLLPLLGLVYFIALFPQAVLSVFQLISYSPIRQCGPFNVSFFGGTPPTALPLTLTVLPLNSKPFIFTVPQSAWDNSTASGSYVVSLPVPEGVSLLASLDDALGNSAAPVSGVIQVRSSNDMSCISTTTNATAPPTFQLLDTAVSQCSPFSVTRNSSSLDYPISVRVLIPTGLSSRLQRTSFHSSQGIDTFTFIMSVARGLQVALLFDDGRENRQVSDLLSVTGVQSTPTGCLQIASTTPTATASSPSLSRTAVIAIAATSSVVVVIIIILGVLFIRRERRKLATGNIIQNQAQCGEPCPAVSPPGLPGPFRMPPFAPTVRVPTDPMCLPGSSPRSSVFSPFIPSSLGRSQSNTSLNASLRTKSTIGRSNSRPLVDLDIEGLLEVASVRHREAELETHSNSSLRIPASTTAVLPSSPAPSLKVDRHSSGWNRGHRDLDVPLSTLRRSSGASLTARRSSVLAQETRVATLKNDGLSSRGTSPNDAGARSRGKKPVRF